ncbi:MAG: histidine kinase [Saprospiraceae bacterium]
MPTLQENFTISNCYIINYIVLSGLTVGLFYFNYYFAIPHYYFKQKKFAFTAMLIGFIIASLVLFVIYVRVFSMQCNPDLGTLKALLRGTLPRFIMVLIASFIMRLNERIKSIEMEKSKAELALLRTQINPHFLFNVLNNIYGQAIIKSDHTADSIAKLSDLMRYSLNEANVSTVSLDK